MPPLGVWLRKDPDSRIPVGIDWTNWLQDNGSLRIVESVWLAPTGITLEGASILPDGTGTAVVVLGGVVSDTPVMLTNRVTDDQGYIDDRSIPIVVQER